MQAPSRILVVRMSAIGDVLMATPVARALKAESPESHLVWLVEDTAWEVLTGNPSIDEVLVMPKKRWVGLWRKFRFVSLIKELFSFVSALRQRKFDLALDLQGLLKSAVWAYLSGARVRVGLASREGSGLLMNRVVPREQDQSRIGSEYLHLVRTLGVEPGEFRMEMAIGDRDGQYARRLREQHGITGRYAVFSPFTTRPHKHWLEDRWAELARLLSSEQGISTTLLVGADGDVAAAGRIESLSGGLALNIAGRTTLKEAAAVIRDASVLVGVDTGLTHMGIALGVPVVAVFGATLPYTDTASENATVLYKKMQCSPCNKKPTCEGSTVCMEAVTVRDVMEAVAEVLGAGKR